MPEDDKKDAGKIILQTKMHCDACRFKVYKAIIGYPGIEDLTIDFKNNKVTLKAPKVDAKKLFEVTKKKSGGKIIKLLYPDPNQPKKKEEEKKPAEVTVVLKVNMNCSSCTDKVVKAAWGIKDVYNVKPDGQTLTLKGWDLDPKKVCGEISKKSGKHVEIVPPKKNGDKKDGESKKEGEKKDGTANKEEKQTPKIVIHHYTYPPQYFSDENPNACAVM